MTDLELLIDPVAPTKVGSRFGPDYVGTTFLLAATSFTLLPPPLRAH
jgi:hypothetical protein